MATTAELSDIEKLKVADLKKELKNRRLSTVGNKSELIERLQLALHTGSGNTVTEDEVGEFDMLGDVEDEILAEDPKTSNSSLTEEEDMLSPVLDKKNPLAVEKENVLTSTPTKPAFAVKPQVQDAKAFLKVSPVAVKVMSSHERLELRAKRFNVPSSEEARKMQRVLKFGGQAKVGNGSAAATNGAGLDKLQQRASRFGINVSQSMKKLEEKERLQKRKERFGAVVISSKSGDTDEKKKKRAERFGST